MQYVLEAELLKRHIDIQQKILQKTNYKMDEKNQSTEDPFLALS
jgi:hypothetical protein